MEDKVIRKCIRFNPDDYRDRRILEILNALPERKQGAFIKNAILATLSENVLDQEQSIRTIVEGILEEKGLLDIDLKGLMASASAGKEQESKGKMADSVQAAPLAVPAQSELREEPEMNLPEDDEEFDLGEPDEEADENLIRSLSGFSLGL